MAGYPGQHKKGQKMETMLRKTKAQEMLPTKTVAKMTHQSVFEVEQAQGIQKAINKDETPVKEKHARTLVVGTHQEGGCKMFWQLSDSLALTSNHIMCWKFCQVLHRLLRDGHPQVLLDSYRRKQDIIEIGKMWTHVRDYGNMIALYMKVLVQKLDFHFKNQKIPGNLLMTEEELITVLQSDINEYFDMCVQIFDYLEDIIAFQRSVFNSLDMSRANSMTSQGQCRLAPLIYCIQDSCQLYDFAVNILYKLHTALPPDTLSGHRSRFNTMFTQLKDFYQHSSNLQYFKHLVQVPSLPDRPPNFLEAASFDMYSKPVAVVTEREPTPERSPEPSLVDLMETPAQVEPPPVNDQMERELASLRRKIEQLQAEKDRIKREAREEIFRLRDQVRQLEQELSELNQTCDSLRQENDVLRSELAEAQTRAAVGDKAEHLEQMAKASDQKFVKLKDFYTKLREEHVTLLRKEGETAKNLSHARHELEVQEQKVKELEGDVSRLEGEQRVLEETSQQSAASSQQQLQQASLEAHQLNQSKQELEQRIAESESQSEQLNGELSAKADELRKLEQQLQQLKAEHERLGSEAQAAEQRSTAQISDMTVASQQLQNDITQLRNQHDQLLTESQLRAKQLLDRAADAAIKQVKCSKDLSSNEQYTEVRCSAEFLVCAVNLAEPSLTPLRDTVNSLPQPCTDVEQAVLQVTQFSSLVCDVIKHGIGLAHSVPSVEQGEEVTCTCTNVGDEAIAVLNKIKEGSRELDITKTSSELARLREQATELLPKIADVQPEQVGALLDRELDSTTKAVEAAANRIQEMLKESREKQTGIRLEVNQQILDSCTELMQAIMKLIYKSKDLQEEIVAQGRGASSEHDFYKKHHRWTEGLISAAKAVGWGANVLMETAEKVVSGSGKFEELVVCSQEIAASTAQLVVSSKVKADRSSELLKRLFEASKEVTSATGLVVGSAKSGRERVEETDMLDFSRLTLHAAKREEMEAQVHVLELEAKLEKQRKRFSELRKVHYQLEEQQQAELQAQAAKEQS